MNDAIIEVPVLIAGGGPVGVTLAMELASRGIRSMVLERRDDLPPNPRCNTTNARSMEIFRRLGCADKVRQAGLPKAHNTDVVYMTRVNGKEVLRYTRPTTEQVLRGQPEGIGADWPVAEPQHFISQLFMEPVLREHAIGTFGIPVQLGWEWLDVEQHEDHVIVHALDHRSGETRTIRAAYLVGADGGSSPVRHAIGARLQGIAHIRNSCSVFVRSPELSALMKEHPGWMYRFPHNVNIVAIDGVDQWLFHTHVPPGTEPSEFDPEPVMSGAVGQAFAYEALNVTRWTSRAMVADRWRDRRIFLAGDAAHIWIPMGGFGMNAGIGDAATLGWMLAGALQGWFDPKALDAYEIERASLGERVASAANRWGAELRPLLALDAQAVDRLERDDEALVTLAAQIDGVNRTEWESCGMQLGVTYIGSPIIAYDGSDGPAFELDTYRETSWPGARAPHVWRAGQKGVALQDDFGAGFTLLRLGSHPREVAALVSAALERGIPLTVLDVPETEALAKYEGYALVLVRPDQYVAWRSNDLPSDVGLMLDRVTGGLA